MKVSEFLKRAYSVGCNVRVSGAVFFVAREGVTVRIKSEGDDTGHYAISQVAKGNDQAFQPCTPAQASKALKLPRR
jgi:hypothetical protein